MFCPYKNSYLQLVCAVNPRVINKAVDLAMQKEGFDPHCTEPVAQRLESMQPSLYAPHVDVTRARLGYGRVGLKRLIRELKSEDYLVQLQAVHSVLDQIYITENAMFLLDMHLVYRVQELMNIRNPVIREKVCMILTHAANYHQGRMQIMSRPQIIDSLMWTCLRDKKEIRYAAAYCLMTLARDHCASEKILENKFVIENLLKIVVNDHIGIVLIHLKTLENLFEYDQEVPLKLNAFQVMLMLFRNEDTRIVSLAMNCTTQLLKHPIGRKLADEYDLVYVLKQFLKSTDIEVIISTLALLKMATLTTRSKWRAKEACREITKALVRLLQTPNNPIVQLNSLQTLINLCDCPDIRYHMKIHWEKYVKVMKIRTHEEWDGASETTSFGLETGHHYRTISIEKVSSIKNEYGYNELVVNVHSYVRTLRDLKQRLIKAINFKSYRD